MRTAEYMCGVLYMIVGWLRDKRRIPESAALPKRNWKVRLKQEWQTLTGCRIETKRLRHTTEKVGRI